MTDGLVLEMERWDPVNKGIDDALTAGAKIDILNTAEATKVIRDAVTATAPVQAPAQQTPQAGEPEWILTDRGAWSPCVSNIVRWLEWKGRGKDYVRDEFLGQR